MTSRLLKVEGAGNDFVLGIGRWAERLTSSPGLVARLCDRRLGIGADGALALFPDERRRLRLVYHNADGTAASFCANGTRCAARVAVDLLGFDAHLDVQTGWGEIAASVRGSLVSLKLPPPIERPRRLTLESSARFLSGWSIEVGVPHLVVVVEDVDSEDLVQLAPALRQHPELGEQGANVNLVCHDVDGRLLVRTWERGVEGETLSCGSGVVASALLAMAEQGLRRMEVVPRSAQVLVVESLDEPPLSATRLTGPTRLVAEVSPFSEFLDERVPSSE